MTSAAIYLRVSLDRTGEELAVDRQLEDCRAIAAAKGWNVVEVFTDNSISASKRNVRRPSYDRLVEDFHAGRFTAIICYDLDRLTRQPRQLEDWIDAAEDKGLKLVTANGEADLSTDGGRMFARMKSAVARSEIERKSARQTRAALQRAQLGKVPAGVRLTGYNIKGDVIPEEAELVSRIFSSFSTGETLKGIAAKLNAEGQTARNSSAWSSSSVSSILKNPRYAGRAVYRGVTNGHAGNWEAIIDGDLFDAVQARLSDPRRKLNKEGTARKHLGSSIYTCGVCHRPLQTNGERYWCREGGHVTRSMKPIDAHVMATITKRLSQPDTAALLAPSSDARVSALTATIDALRNRQTAIEADYDDGHIDGLRLATALNKLKPQLDATVRERATLTAGSVVGGLITGPTPAYAFENASLDVKRAVIDALVFVRILPAPRGVRGFNPETVLVLWKRSKAVGSGVVPVVTEQAQKALQNA